jgi:hypothetical protein
MLFRFFHFCVTYLHLNIRTYLQEINVLRKVIVSEDCILCRMCYKSN